MYELVAGGGRLSSGRAGFVYDVVSAAERDAYNWRLRRILGDVNAGCGNIEGYRHLLDIGQLTHIYNRHTNPRVEESHGQVALVKADFLLIPEVVDPCNLLQCDLERSLPRLAYAKEVEGGSLVAVEEIRAGRKELVLITLYKRK